MNKRQAERELTNVQGAIYDKPMALEMQREYAFTAFMNTENMMAASEKSGVPIAQITAWAEAGAWYEIKKDHYEKVHLKNREIHDTDIVEQKAQLVGSTFDVILNLLNKPIEDEGITELERAKAVKDLLDVYVKLTGVGEEEPKENAIPGISAENQQVFLNVFSNGSVSDSDSEEAQPQEIEGEYQELLEKFSE